MTNAMTTQNHNKLIGIVLGLLGCVVAGLALSILIQILLARGAKSRPILREPFVYTELPVGLALSLLLWATAYGVLRKRRWARLMSLAVTAPLALIYPLGTILAVSVWKFMQGKRALTLY